MKTDTMLSTREWENAGQHLTVKGHRIFVIDENSNASKDASQDKNTILLIHGFPTSSWDWAKIWPRLSSDYRLIAMDMLGFGYRISRTLITIPFMSKLILSKVLFSS